MKFKVGDEVLIYQATGPDAEDILVHIGKIAIISEIDETDTQGLFYKIDGMSWFTEDELKIPTPLDKLI